MTVKENWLATIGQNIQFVAFWAHLGVAGLVTILFYHFTKYGSYISISIVIGAFIKEYYFDAKYEKNPPQSFLDNTEDFAGWAFGVLIGWLLK